MGHFATDRARSHLSPYSYLWRMLSVERRDLKLVVIYGVAVGVFSLVVPMAAQTLVNTVVFNFLLQPIVVLSLIVVGMLGIAAILKLIQTSVVEVIQKRIFTRIALDLAYRLPRISFEAYDQHRGTELVNRFFEVVTVQKAIAFILVDGLAVVLQAVIGMILLAFYHPLLLAFDLILLIFIILVIFWPSRRGVSTSIYESKTKYRVASWLEEITRNPVAFKMGGGWQYALNQADQITNEYLVARKKHFAILWRQIAGTLVVQTLVSGVFLGLGSYLVLKQQLTLGQLVAAEIIVTMVVSGFAKFGKYLETVYDLLASTDKLSYLFELPQEGSSLVPFEPKSGPFSVRLKNVNFIYNETGHQVLSDIDLEIKSGERCGLLGGNGAGKSTVLDIILGFRKPTQGSIEIQNSDLRDYDIHEMRRHIALVRDIEVIDGTILDNIRLGRDYLSIEDVREALETVGLLGDVAALPDGLATDLSGSLSPFSAGQTKRLMLARAIVAKPKLLLLDEALDDIDLATKKDLMDRLFDPNAPWTIVMATHDPKEVALCTRIIQMAEGKMISQTSHTERRDI
jgi:putative ABC transport system ATP-binding protein